MSDKITPDFIAATLKEARELLYIGAGERIITEAMAGTNRRALIAIIEAFQEGDSYMNVCRIASDHRVERDAARQNVERLKAENKRLQSLLSPEVYLKFIREKNSV